MPHQRLRSRLGPSRGQHWAFWLIALGAASLVAYVAIDRLRSQPQRSRPAEPEAHVAAQSAHAGFVGAEACRACHAEQYRAWLGSHHRQAMQPAEASTVLGDFADARFEHFGVETVFTQRDGQFFVRTDGPDGQPAEYEIKYTFGVSPLQQYLAEFPGGRYQSLGVAWDSRSASVGGQRWFHLYPNEKLDHTDQLHWTGPYQNWNLMCAECHSTNVRKGYDAATNGYRTTYSEINVSCEACHGAGAQHVAWAEQAKPPYPSGTDMGLVVRLASGWNTAWKPLKEGARFPQRDPPAAEVLNVCAACHARRSTLREGGTPGAPLEETHRLAMLTEPLYHADGQQRDEVYTWGSFLQSRMYQRGVTCLDCHEPHSSKTRFAGNALCARCHDAAIFDGPQHHFHQSGSSGASCVACHMPSQKYMVVHDRLDHSLRVPRPDVAAALGDPHPPDACTMCHADRQPAWAAAAMDGWYGPAWRTRRLEWGTTLRAGATRGPAALVPLLDLARDPVAPAIVRATAATIAQPLVQPDSLPIAQSLLKDADPSVRIAALGLLEPFDAPTRAAQAGPLLADSVRGVRIDAARLLADVPAEQLAPELREPRQRALDEYLAALELNADWPAENVNRGNLALRQGRPEAAVAAYRRAIKLDPRFVGAYVNLADVYRQLSREDEGEDVLRRGLKAVPASADLHHALGLLLVRKGNAAAALDELAAAARLAPENVRYAYVYAVGLSTAGQVGEALDVLRAADARRPHDPDLLSALVSLHRQRNQPGDQDAALRYARRLAEMLPEDAGIKHLVDELEQNQ